MEGHNEVTESNGLIVQTSGIADADEDHGWEYDIPQLRERVYLTAESGRRAFHSRKQSSVSFTVSTTASPTVYEDIVLTLRCSI